jgi:hypothetical protein
MLIPLDRMRTRFSGLWGFLTILIVLGCGLLVLASAIELSSPLHDLVPELGTALLVGGLLGVSVDRWLKTRLLRDAFKSLFGYLLPEELRDELDWVYTRDILCVRSDLTLTIARTGDGDLFSVRLDWSRDLRNITTRVVPFRVRLSVEEWFHADHQSRILALVATYDGKPHAGIKAGYREKPDDASSNTAPEPFMLTRELDEEPQVKPGECLTLVCEAEEARHMSDAWYLNMLYATANPRVTVRAPDEIAWRVRFGNRNSESVRVIGPATRELPGTLLPGQFIQVRWWPRQAQAEREPTTQSDDQAKHSAGNGAPSHDPSAFHQAIAAPGENLTP